MIAFILPRIWGVPMQINSASSERGVFAFIGLCAAGVATFMVVAMSSVPLNQLFNMSGFLVG
jgi:hypothetical protein